MFDLDIKEKAIKLALELLHYYETEEKCKKVFNSRERDIMDYNDYHVELYMWVGNLFRQVSDIRNATFYFEKGLKIQKELNVKNT